MRTRPRITKPNPWVTEQDGKTYAGPMPLREALDLCEPRESGVRMAVSTPEAALVAIEFVETGRILIRRVNDMSGRSGSTLNTGEWIDPAQAEHAWRMQSSWRPA